VVKIFVGLSRVEFLDALSGESSDEQAPINMNINIVRRPVLFMVSF
jgi:hypothetical protein